jgi:hypothetical protein
LRVSGWIAKSVESLRTAKVALSETTTASNSCRICGGIGGKSIPQLAKWDCLLIFSELDLRLLWLMHYLSNSTGDLENLMIAASV